MRRSHKFLRNISSIGIARIWSLALAFFTTPYILKKLGADVYGLMSVLTAFAGYFTLADLGFTSAIEKYIAEFKARKDHDRILSVVQTGIFFYTWVAIGCGFIVFIGFQFYLQTLDFPIELKYEVYLCTFVVSFGFSVSLIGNFLRSIIRGYQRFDFLGIIAIGIRTLNVLLVVLVLYFGYGLLSIMMVTLFISLVSLFLLYFFVKRNFNEIILFPRWNKSTFFLLFQFSKWKILSGISIKLLNNTSKLIIASLAGLTPLTYFIIPQMLAEKAGRGIAVLINRICYPLMSESVAIENVYERKKLYFRLVKWVFSILGLGTVFFVVFADKILEFWIGSDMSLNGTFILRSFVMIYWFTTILPLGVTVFEAYGNTRFPSINSLSSVLCALLFYFIFIPFWGIKGVVVAHIISLLFAVYFQHRLLRLLHSNWHEFYKQCLNKTLFSSTIVGIIMAVFRYIDLNALGLITLIPISLLLHCTMYYFFHLHDVNDYEIIMSFIKSIKLKFFSTSDSITTTMRKIF